MIKKASIFALIVSLFLFILLPGLVQAQGGLKVLDSSAEVEFPLQLRFSLSASSDVNITDIRLQYAVDRESFAQVVSEAYINFTPDTSVDVEWSLDMRRVGGLPPESIVSYWWIVEDAGGDKLRTTPVKVHFDDTRYSWKSLTEGEVAIYWYRGEKSFAEELMLTAQEALVRLAEDTGARLKRPVKIYVYGDSGDLQGAMIFPKEWTGGVAYTEYGIIAIGIAPNDLGWGKGAVIHELTHLVIHQMTFNPYNDLPRWLDEGLAMYNEGLLNPGYAGLLKKAIAEDSIFTVRTLSSEFSVSGEQAALAYAQSYSLVEFLVTTYGSDKMFDLLTTFSEGRGYYDGALEEVYGFDRDGLNELWREYVFRQYGETASAIIPNLVAVPCGR